LQLSDEYDWSHGYQDPSQADYANTDAIRSSKPKGQIMPFEEFQKIHQRIQDKLKEIDEIPNEEFLNRESNLFNDLVSR
jgi:hypothetical protein